MRDGRVWQTLDRGESWAEVAAPPATRKGGLVDPSACSLVGCDLGAWYRIGWSSTPPVPLPPLTTAPPAPRLERSPAATMTCRTAGAPKHIEARRSDRSPDDLGLGASRVGVSAPSGQVDFLRMTFSRSLVGPVRDVDASEGAAVRALVHGPSTEPGNGRLVVRAPNRDVLSLARQLSFVPAFDPLGAVRRAPLAMRDIVAAAHASGAGADEALGVDPTPSGVVPVTPVDPGAPDDLAVQLTGRAIAVAGASTGKVEVAFEAARGDEWRVVSAVDLNADAAAWLEEDAAGHARVVRAGPGRPPSIAFELEAPPSGELYPANVDALAVGPAGDLAILMTPSGGEPPSAIDPAVAIVPGAPPISLAPWSTLASAEDAACKAEKSGWRATVQVIAPWIKLVGAAELRGVDVAPMLARVRWSASRVCLEAVEVRAQDASVAGAPSSDFGTPWDAPVQAWVVARFAGGVAAGRVVVVAGGEMRQPLECTL
jgi:hypothetical protein